MSFEDASRFSLVDFGAGWFSGLCGLVVGHPFDTVKVRQQTYHKGGQNVILSMYKKEGISSFYKGMFMPLMTSGLLNAIYFGCYGNCLRYLASFRGETAPRTCCDPVFPAYRYFHLDVMLAGCVAGLITTFVACPIDLSKIKLQTQIGKVTKKFMFDEKPKLKYSGTVDCLVNLFRVRGIRGIYKGLAPMLVRDPLASGVYMYLYVAGLELFPQKNTLSIMIAGANAGIWSWVLIIPVDVVKSRIQADSTSNPKYKGMLDCAVQSYRKDGASVFMRGFWMTVIRAAPVNAATFAGYELFIQLYFDLRNRVTTRNITAGGSSSK